MNGNRPNPVCLLANEMGYEAAVIGNHEFNYGKKFMADMVEESSFPWLSANILHDKTGVPYYGKPYIMKEFGEVRVGILGLTTSYIPNWEEPGHIRGMEFADVIATCKKWVHYLRTEEKADVVVVAYHGGFERDLVTGEATEKLTGENQGYQLCAEIDGIDVLITGHQHRELAGQKVNDVIVLQPGVNGANLGKITLSMRKGKQGWHMDGHQSRSTLLPVKGVEEDANLLKLVESYEVETQTWLDQTIGEIDGNMLIDDPMEIRLRDNALIEFLNRIQMHAANVAISNTALFDNEAKGFPENVTMRDIVSSYKYPNTLKVIRLTGKDIKQALEKSAAYFKQYTGGEIEINPSYLTPKPQHYNYDMWEGINYDINISKPIGERIENLNIAGKQLNMEAEYDVVMNNYRAGGGGNFDMYKGKQVVKEIPIQMSELIADYILEKKVVKAKVDRNWKVIF
jgi:2',3'-cyclic-nucleotide 2'-phosphodiesterase/3'-nucleotidase